MLSLIEIDGVNANYLGCYADFEIVRDLPIQMPVQNTMKIETCLAYCANNGYALYGLQNRYHITFSIANSHQNIRISRNLNQICLYKYI